MTDAPEPSALVFECDLDAPPEKVWRALATPELREAWLGEPEAGPSEVTRAEAGERLDLVWPTHAGETLVSFEIAAGAAGGTHLTIVHRALAPAVARRRPRRAATPPAGGWRMAA
jgi:uncharacterized protein YndB with AHSA1/START domain